ncbi:MAG TPA: cytochrome c3 family protein [Verrucomicrobiae bacterium]|jgi:formate-dependent nitrite reductase cytochrome c552 subunit|nr:cytochrome c3 family protein [Verrucomicrobiae bacterium]
MSDIFPKWTNQLPRNIIISAVLLGAGLVAGSTYYFTPKYARVGYQPQQPVAFPHSVHVTQLGMDCRYCHNGVEKSWYSNIPATSVCMNCHSQVLKDDPRLAPVRESAASGKPIPWIQIHKLPDYVYFNHSVHVNRGVSCVECHGRIDQMDEVYHAKPFSMSFCLDCHRAPASHLRPLDKITDLGWEPTASTPREVEIKKLADGKEIMEHWKVQSLQNCSTCHR